MFSWLKKLTSPSAAPAPRGHPTVLAMRDTLFGDLPIERWGGDKPPEASEEPWRSFGKANFFIKSNRRPEAVVVLREIIARPGLESRHYAQAWHFLRGLGVQPEPTQGKQVLGVVLEVPMHDGLDLLAVYPDRTARYWNYMGGGVVWEHPDASLDSEINAVLEAARGLVLLIGPWDEPRRGVPKPGDVRATILTPSGIHFGEGPMDAISRDALGGPVMMAATRLMMQMTKKKPG